MPPAFIEVSSSELVILSMTSFCCSVPGVCHPKVSFPMMQMNQAQYSIQHRGPLTLAIYFLLGMVSVCLASHLPPVGINTSFPGLVPTVALLHSEH